MIALIIKKYPNPILRKKSEEVKEISQEIKNLGWDMTETMTKNKGIGLAAPQIGELKRIIVARLIKDRFPESKSGVEPQVFINPKIIKKSRETEIDEEGCLSIPMLRFKIKRAKEVEVKALNIEGIEVKIKTQGLPARILQHEIDHLNGILLIDRVSFWQRLKIKSKLKKINFE